MQVRILILLALGLLVFLSACGAGAPAPGDPPPTATALPGQLPPGAVPTDFVVIPPSGEAAVVIWQRSGGIAGICYALAITETGEYALQGCEEGATPRTGQMSPQQQAQLNQLLDRYATFEWRFVPPPDSADMFQETYIFYGRGSRSPTEAEQEEIGRFLAELVNEILRAQAGGAATAAHVMPPAGTPQAGTTPAGGAVQAGSGIEGLVTVGPACPGPVRADRACPEAPYQATFTVLDGAGQVVARFETDAGGHFRVDLPPGVYTLRPETTGAYPRAADQDVTVNAGQFTLLQIKFDSGIR